MTDTQLARSQHARRDRIVEAVLELATEGGYDAVQVREVASRADVALRTIYNYYGSRENMLLDAMVQWRSRVVSESVASVRGDTFEERVLSLLRHNFEEFEQRPKLFEAFMRVGLWTGNSLDVPTWAQDMKTTTEAALADLDPQFVEDFEMILVSVVYASMSFAAAGHIPVSQVWVQVERTVRRLALSKGQKRTLRSRARG
jgi:AcrR family transcriptional regulator